jgi:NitT/TauT family transport system substrate-binding protein
VALRVGHLSSFYHTAPLLIARTDVPERLGTEVSWLLFGTGPAIVEAFERGELDLAYIGLPPAIIGMARGVHITCIAGGHIEGTIIAGNEHCTPYPEASTLEAVLEQFRGKVLGVPGKGSIHDVILSDSLSLAGLTGEVEVINFRWADEIVDAMAHSAVQGAFGTPALATAVRRFARGRLLYPPDLLWPSNPSYGIVASRAFIERQRGVAEKFLALHEEATRLLREQPDEASGTIAGMVGIVGREYILETLNLSPRYCAQLTEDYIGCTMRFVAAMKTLGYIDAEIAEDAIFDTSLIRSVHPPGDHYSYRH